MNMDPNFKISPDDVEPVACLVCGSPHFIQVFRAAKPKTPILLGVPEGMVFASKPELICMGCNSPLGMTKEEAIQMKQFVENFNNEASKIMENMPEGELDETQLKQMLENIAHESTPEFIKSKRECENGCGHNHHSSEEENKNSNVIEFPKMI